MEVMPHIAKYFLLIDLISTVISDEYSRITCTYDFLNRRSTIIACNIMNTRSQKIIPESDVIKLRSENYGKI